MSSILQKKIISLITSCTQKSHLLQLHTYLLRSSHFYNSTIFLSFLSRFVLPPLRDLSYSYRVFSQFPKPKKTLYNTMIRGHSLYFDSAPKGLQFFQELLHLGISPNAFSSTFALKCCIKIESLPPGLQIHGRILKDGNLSETLLLTTLMEFYSVLDEGKNAYKLFDEMQHKDIVAWNVLISCYAREGRTRDVLSLFDWMRNSNGPQPDDVTCLLVLQACSSLNALEFGEKVHWYITEKNISCERNIWNSLVCMYSRCGCLEKAYIVFNQIVDKDVVTWTTMISGLASNGYGRDAINVFKEMQKEGVIPNDHTFSAVLSGCSQSGLVSEGRMFFDSLSADFGVNPNIHHYGCMVDLLGRVGLLDQACDLITSMKIKPDPTMWRTLLGACRIHRNFSLGEKAIHHLVELKATVPGDYVLLSNIYSSLGNMEKVQEVRKMMKETGMETLPAISTVEWRGKVHEFRADDVAHANTKEIYEMLDEIYQQLRMGGYVFDASTELYNLDLTSKKLALSYHSEKLAIAFGVLSTPPGTTIRVAKDLRICVDCHNFSKQVSAVYTRKVIIRDRNRFHHFVNGSCSCNDYW